MDRTATGLAKRGYVVNVLVDGTTGMISFEVFKQIIDFRPLSDRALVVPEPPRDIFLVCSWLHPLKVWGLRESRGGSLLKV